MILPLRKRKRTGELYHRMPKVVAEIGALSSLSKEDLISRCKIHNLSNSDYVSSECILYFLRRTKINKDHEFKELYRVLRKRVLNAIPGYDRWNSYGKGDKKTLSDLAGQVRFKFDEMLVKDRIQYNEALDFYEIAFVKGITSLYISEKRKRKNSVSLHDDKREGGITKDAESALQKLLPDFEENAIHKNYREKFYAAIEQLPPKEQQVIKLLLEGYQIDSEDPTIDTIAKIAQCAERTVRTRRDRAIRRLQKILGEEINS